MNINKGDTVNFHIGLSGNGKINSKYLKFTLYSDATSEIFMKGLIGSKHLLAIAFPPESQEKVNALFLSTDFLTLKADETSVTSNKYFSIVPKESGNTTIKVIATYSADGKLWQTEESFINFHVNTWYEEYETPLVVLGLFLAIIALLDPISNVYIKTKKKFFQKPE